MADVAETVVAALAAPVAAIMPVITARIPSAPAAQLGRSATPPGAGPGPGASGLRQHVVAYPRLVIPGAPAESGAQSLAIQALQELEPLLAERLHGALELTVPELDLGGAADLSPYVGRPPAGISAFALAGSRSGVRAAAELLETLRPGIADLIASLARQLSGHPAIAPLLEVAPDLTGEATIAAAHGRAYLALTVAAASAVLSRYVMPDADDPAAAIVGVALGAAALLLRQTPMPAGYAAALLEKTRAEYRPPRGASWLAAVSGHRFALAEGETPAAADFSSNGLVAAIPGGAFIRTGSKDGAVSVTLSVLDEPPPVEDQDWDEVAEVSWRAAVGQATATAAFEMSDSIRQRVTTPPWPGDYRLRVHARARDDADDEEYCLAVWQAPAAPEIVYKRTDRLGARLRGEPEPTRPQQPEPAYRWVKDTSIELAATVTVVTGTTVAQVLEAFGADPSQPESLRELDDEGIEQMLPVPAVAVLDIGNAVLAVEYGGFLGTDETILCQASVSGRAASMYWNAMADQRLSFAEAGQMLASFDPVVEPPPGEEDSGPAVGRALAGLDFTSHRDTKGKGLVAVERFTGHRISEGDLDRIEAADIAYRTSDPVSG